MRTVSGAFAALAALLLVLCGCAPSGPRPSSTPGPSPTPIFATEADALAAATDAYAAYQRALDMAFATYETHQLRKVASGTALQAATSSVAEYKANGKHQIGNSLIDNISLVNSDPTAILPGGSPLQIYACLDVSQTDVRDSTGASIVPTTRPTRYPLLVSFVWRTSAKSLVVMQEEEWTGVNFCQ